MRSGTSCFNVTVWKKTFLRFWPIWAANLTVWLIVFPLNGLLRLREGSLKPLAVGLMQGNGLLLALGAACISLLAAMAACGHLYNSRSANFFGAVPLKREGVFLSTYLAGLAMLILPNLVIFVLMLLLELAGGALYLPVLLLWLAAVCGMELFFYSFAVFCGMFTGHILALPVYYGVFNVMALAVYGLVYWIMGGFYYGFNSESLDGFVSVVERLTPVWALSKVGFTFKGMILVTESFLEPQYSGVPELIAYVAAGLLLVEGAALLYKYRQMESAGDIVSVKPLRPVFRYGVAVCAGLLFGFVTAAILSLEELGLAVCIVIWGVIGCFVAQMLLDKKFNVFRKWKGPAVLAAVFIVVFLVIGFDLTGYETRVPAVDRVEYAEVTGLGSWPNDGGSYWNSVRVDDPEDLELVTALHRAAVADRNDMDYHDAAWNFRVVYHLEDGTTLARRYEIYGDADELDTPGSTAWLVQRLLDDRELTRRAYGLDETRTLLEKGGELTEAVFVTGGGKWNNYQYEWPAPGPVEDPPVTEQSFYGPDALDLWDAALADFNDGALGRHIAAAPEEYVRPPYLYFKIEHPSKAWADENPSQGALHIEIALSETAARTWSALERRMAANG